MQPFPVSGVFLIVIMFIKISVFLVYSPVSDWTSLADLLRPSMQTTKNIHVETFVRDNDDDPLCWESGCTGTIAK